MAVRSNVSSARASVLSWVASSTSARDEADRLIPLAASEVGAGRGSDWFAPRPISNGGSTCLPTKVEREFGSPDRAGGAAHAPCEPIEVVECTGQDASVRVEREGFDLAVSTGAISMGRCPVPNGDGSAALGWGERLAGGIARGVRDDVKLFGVLDPVTEGEES